MSMSQRKESRALSIALCLPLLLLPGLVLAQGGADALAHKGAVSMTGVLQMVTGLIAVLALIFAGAWLLKRFGRLQGGANADLRVVSGINLGQRERIVIVQAGSDRLLIGVAPGCIRTLHVLEPAPEVGDTGGGTPAPTGFLGRFNQELKKRMSLS
jgi:flagellar protein FliO/FliZ